MGRDKSRLDSLAATGGGLVTPVAADLASAEGRDTVVQAVTDPLISLVHGAASRISLAPWADIDPDALVDHFRVHVAVPIALTRAVSDRSPPRRMVIIDSFSATTPRIGWSAYAMVKAAAQMSARAASRELGGTLVARVFPGAVDTPLLREVLDGADEVPAVALYQSIEAGGRVSDPIDVGQEIANIILDVTDDELAATEEWHVGHSTTSSD